MLGVEPSSLRGWCQRRDGGENVFFVVEDSGRSAFYRVKKGVITVFDPVTGNECGVDEWRKPSSAAARKVAVDLKPVEDYPVRATRRIYEGTVEIADVTAGLRLDLGRVRDWATVYVNGRKAADLWCEPYACDISQFVEKGRPAAIRVEVVSTWYNALVEDAKLPEKERLTWTLFGPNADAQYHDAGLLGPVRLEF